MKHMRKAAAALLVTMTLMAVPLGSEAAGQRFEDSGTMRQVVLGTGTGLTSFVYCPVKFFYAAGATITGGLILAFTGGEATETAAGVVRRGVGGDWYVHPDVFTGRRQLHFNGEAQ